MKKVALLSFLFLFFSGIAITAFGAFPVPTTSQSVVSGSPTVEKKNEISKVEKKVQKPKAVKAS